MFADPPIIDRGPQSQEVVVGDDVTLTCSARGNPAISYNWFFVSSSIVSVNVLFISMTASKHAFVKYLSWFWSYLPDALSVLSVCCSSRR